MTLQTPHLMNPLTLLLKKVPIKVQKTPATQHLKTQLTLKKVPIKVQKTPATQHLKTQLTLKKVPSKVQKTPATQHLKTQLNHHQKFNLNKRKRN